MASAPSKSRLTDRLESLSPAEFETFGSRLLRDRKIPQDELRPVIFDPRKVADLLVKTFTEDGALKVAEETLRQSDSSDDRKAKPWQIGGYYITGLHGNRHIVDDLRELLITRVRDVDPILDELLSKGVIDQENYEKISALPDSEDQMRELLGLLKSDGDKDIFYDIIKDKPISPPFEGLSEVRQSGFYECQEMLMKSQRHASHWVRHQRPPVADWIKLEPEVNVDTEDAPIYSLQSEAGHFECSVSGFRWVCEEKVSFRYHFGSWEEHTGRMEIMQYVPGGPLIDIKLICGKFDEAYLPHWICTEDIPEILDKVRVLHFDTCVWSVFVEQVSEITPSHVKLSQPNFSPRGVMMRAGFPVKINCNVLIYKTNKAFLTLHVYLIPHDPALQQTIKKNELPHGSKLIPKPHPEKFLKMRDHFVLSANVDGAEIYPDNLKLRYDGCDPNFYEVFVEKPDKHFVLTLQHESVPVWTCAIRQDDYENAGDLQVKYEEDLGRVRPQLVKRLSREVINQLLDDLLKDGVFNDGEKEMILEENSSRADRARCLVDTVKKKGREASRKMFDHLQSREPTLSAELKLLPV